MTDAELTERIARRLWAAQGDTLRPFEDTGQHWRKIFLNLAREILPLVKYAQDSLGGMSLLAGQMGSYRGYTDKLIDEGRQALRPWVGEESE